MDYNPFTGMSVTGWPVTVLGRGQRIVENGALCAKPGAGRFVKRAPIDLTGRAGQSVAELDLVGTFGARMP
jgi:dihydropyrimidinase